ncbi:MAG: hypothetical protein QME52_05315 [Bacteroidota bacterium]|nr:hypothetical protein [Bacteroidota bacterium]
MKPWNFIFIAILFFTQDLYTQASYQDDPAYKTYKEGYNLILDERWDEARKKFAEIIFKYPKSSFLDDAHYWSAYGLKYTNRKKAIEAYNKFISNFSSSSYYDDAVTDLAELKKERAKGTEKLKVKGSAQVYITDDGLMIREGKQAMHIGEDGIVIGEGPDSVIISKNAISISSDGKSFRFGYGTATKARTLERALRLYQRKLSRPRLPHIVTIPSPVIAGDDDLDPQTKLKLEALYALGDAKEDEQSYNTLKEIALDFKQPRQLREAALYVLADYKKFDVLNVFSEIVKNDTSEEMQSYAIDYISEHGKDKKKTVGILIQLFDSIPSKRTQQREMIFYSIADIGNEQAIDFFGKVARTSNDYELRREAVYYLGSIGGEKARRVLYEILKEK